LPSAGDVAVTTQLVVPLVIVMVAPDIVQPPPVPTEKVTVLLALVVAVTVKVEPKAALDGGAVVKPTVGFAGLIVSVCVNGVVTAA
jgi:hypothetical protein